MIPALVFLVVFVITLIKAVRGSYSETLCNVASALGIVSSIAGLIVGLFTDMPDVVAVLYVGIMIFSFFIKRIARQFDKLHRQKIEEELDRIAQEERRYAEMDAKPAVYTEDNFDDPNLRFNGEYTDVKHK